MVESSFVIDVTFSEHHTLLPLADLDRSVVFYTGLVGMKSKERHASQTRKVEAGFTGAFMSSSLGS